MLNSVQAAFKLFDRDGSGSLSALELKAVLKRPGGGAPLSDEEIGSIISEFDVNGDGELQYSEFESFWAPVEEEDVVAPAKPGGLLRSLIDSKWPGSSAVSTSSSSFIKSGSFGKLGTFSKAAASGMASGMAKKMSFRKRRIQSEAKCKTTAGSVLESTGTRTVLGSADVLGSVATLVRANGDGEAEPCAAGPLLEAPSKSSSGKQAQIVTPRAASTPRATGTPRATTTPCAAPSTTLRSSTAAASSQPMPAPTPATTPSSHPMLAPKPALAISWPATGTGAGAGVSAQGTTKAAKMNTKGLISFAKLEAMAAEQRARAADTDAELGTFGNLPSRLGRSIGQRRSNITEIVRQWDINSDGEISKMEVNHTNHIELGTYPIQVRWIMVPRSVPVLSVSPGPQGPKARPYQTR